MKKVSKLITALLIAALILLSLFLVGCEPVNSKGNDAKELFHIKTVKIPIEEGMNVFVFEHFNDKRWIKSISCWIPDASKRSDYDLHWLSGNGRREIIYALPNSRCFFNLDQQGEVHLYSDEPQREEDGKYNLFRCVSDVGDFACVRVYQEKHAR